MRQSIDFDEFWMAVQGGYIPSVSSSMKPQMTTEQGIDLQRAGVMWFSQEYGCWLVKRLHPVTHLPPRQPIRARPDGDSD